MWVEKFVCSALDFRSGKKFCSNATPGLRLVNLGLLSRSYLILLMDKLAASDVGDIYVLKKWSKKGYGLPVWPGVWKPRAVKGCWWCRSILLRPFWILHMQRHHQGIYDNLFLLFFLLRLSFMCILKMCIQTDHLETHLEWFYVALAARFCSEGRVWKGSPSMNRDNHADVKQKVGAAACEELIWTLSLVTDCCRLRAEL